jgi:hypothetical protein
VASAANFAKLELPENHLEELPMYRCLTIILFLGAALNAAAQAPCERLKSLALPDTTITAAESVAAGPYKPQSKGAGSTNDAASFSCVAPAGTGKTK